MKDVSFRKRFTRSFVSRVARDLGNRSPYVTGADALLDPQGDLQVNSSGDIAVTTGADCIIKGLLRRLGTPPSGYARFVKGPNGLSRVDETYLDRLYDYLSGPLTFTNLSQMQTALRRAAELDGRVEIFEVRSEGFNYASNTVNLSITYRVKLETELKTLNLTI